MTVYGADDAQTELLALVVLRALVVSAAAASADTAGRKPFIAPAAKAHGAACRISDELRRNPGVSNAADSAKYTVYSCAGEQRPAPKDAADAIYRSTNLSGGVAAIALDADKPGAWSPLWHSAGMSADLNDLWRKLKNQLGSGLANWSFWIEWYEAILNGTPLPWELTHRIALQVTDEEWNAGQATVALRIDAIRTKLLLEKEIEQLKKQLSQATKQATAHRKHNNPPPLDDDHKVGAETITLIWADLEALEAEIANPNAEPSALQKIAQRLWAIAKKITRYCGGKIDTTLEAAAKELGSTGTRWVVGSGAVYWLSTQEGTQSVAKLAWQYAEKLLAGG